MTTAEIRSALATLASGSTKQQGRRKDDGWEFSAKRLVVAREWSALADREFDKKRVVRGVTGGNGTRDRPAPEIRDVGAGDGERLRGIEKGSDAVDPGAADNDGLPDYVREFGFPVGWSHQSPGVGKQGRRLASSIFLPQECGGDDVRVDDESQGLPSITAA